MRALVLGGAGFVGLHLVERLSAEGCQVTVVDDFSRGSDDERVAALRARAGVDVVSADLTRPEAWARLQPDVDQVYLLAAVVGVRNVEADPSRVLRVNTLTVAHLVNWLRPGPKVFFSSTSEIYAGGVDAGLVPVPTPEDVPIMVADVASPRMSYAISKLAGEAMLLHHARATGVPVVIGRFHNVYGPRMGADHVVPEMALRAMEGENPFRVWGADQYRAFCYVDDAIEAAVRLMGTAVEGPEIVHIGNDREQTNIADLARLVLDVVGVSATLLPMPAPDRSVRRRCPDLGNLRRLTGFEPTVSLTEGVSRTVDWYRGWRQTIAMPGQPTAARDRTPV
ncbi:NAD-dependent epimerase/dehydratase family protein [Micromonospora tulbaghiae]|uniref:NAD-dependent epimerase/dehydratase family protein n=1 Tax=Micromonospora tulbaghiae TaxID=479978 RepID=UPI0034081ED2